MSENRCETHDVQATLFCTTCSRPQCDQCVAPRGVCQRCELEALSGPPVARSYLSGFTPRFWVLLLFVFLALAGLVGGCVGPLKWLEHHVHT
jgi:B-box zinc finger